MPSHVVVWPVLVQGEGAADQITNAINGFNAMDGTTLPRPNLLIVARGGGSLEDLMAFNEENVVRATANSKIPIISAVGHETDTTLIDYAADLRAPTPTGAAEMAVPVRANLLAQIIDDEKRLINACNRLVTEYRHKLDASARGLGDPEKLLTIKTQTIDHLSDKLGQSFSSFLSTKREKLLTRTSRLRHPQETLINAQTRLDRWSDQLKSASPNITKKRTEKINHLGKMLEAIALKKLWNAASPSYAHRMENPSSQAQKPKHIKPSILNFKTTNSFPSTPETLPRPPKDKKNRRPKRTTKQHKPAYSKLLLRLIRDHYYQKHRPNDLQFYSSSWHYQYL